MKEAQFYKKINNKIICELCPHFCLINENSYGFCGVRKNNNETLVAESYGQISSISVDPIEKKPLYHFFPNSKILSIGSYGCNMKCLFCQNHTISQNKPKTEFIFPKKLLEISLSIPQNLGVAFTYNEPLISFEYILECAEILKNSNLKVVIVSNGLINSEPLDKLLPYTDAFNIDLKAFNPEFYQKHGGNLEIVKQNIKKISQKCHIEITSLIIPNANDKESEISALAQWISKISCEIPLHISRFFPRHKMLDLAPTPIENLHKISNISKKFLKYVHIGNI